MKISVVFVTLLFLSLPFAHAEDWAAISRQHAANIELLEDEMLRKSLAHARFFASLEDSSTHRNSRADTELRNAEADAKKAEMFESQGRMEMSKAYRTRAIEEARLALKEYEK